MHHMKQKRSHERNIIDRTEMTGYAHSGAPTGSWGMRDASRHGPTPQRQHKP